MSWAEAVLLAYELAADPSSRLSASLQGWTYPLSFEGAILAGCFNLLGAQMKAPPTWPVPWLTGVAPEGAEPVVQLTQEQIDEQLRLMSGR